MTAPSIAINGGAAGVKAALTAATSFTATLDDTAGVRSVAWSIASTDETSAVASYTLVTSGTVGQTVTATSLGQGTAGLLKAVVNGGQNLQTGLADAAGTTATIKFYVPLSDGGEVGCAGEKYESDPTFGSTGIINSAIRKAAAVAPSGVAVKIVKAATTAALPANHRSGNVLTADANGTFAAVDGVTIGVGERFLAKDEGGGASHVNNGPYTLTTAGSGGAPWTATRATDFDDSSELIQGTRFTVQQGTVYGGKEVLYVTAGATINVTALAFEPFAYAPNDAAFLTVGASSLLSAERNISAVGTTLPFASTTTNPCSFSREVSATGALVDVNLDSALCSGTTTAGFGIIHISSADAGSGGPQQIGALAYEWTDVTGASEDSKATVYARTAGSALASVAEFSGTAVKLPALAGAGGTVEVDAAGVLSVGPGGGASTTAAYLTDDTTADNANDVPVRALASTLGIAGAANVVPISLTYLAATGSGASGYSLEVRRALTSGVGTTGTFCGVKFTLPDYGSGADIAAGTARVEATAGLGTTIVTKLVLALPNGAGPVDLLTLSGAGLVRLHGSAYASAGGRFVVDGSGNVTLSAISESELRTAAAALTTSLAVNSQKITGLTAGSTTGDAVEYDQLNTAIGAAAFVPTSRTLTGATPIAIAGDYSAHDLSANRTISFVPSGAVAWGGFSITGISALDNSAGTFTLGANTTSQTIGKASTTASFPGLVAVADLVTINKDNITTTQTRGLQIGNDTNSGTQYSPQLGFHAWNGGVRQNVGLVLEPQSTSRAILRLYYGTGTGLPSSTGTYFDNSDSNFGSCVVADAFVCRSTSFTGFRFNDGNNRGGLSQDNSNNAIVLKSYNTKDLRFETGADSGGSSGVVRGFWSGAGLGRMIFVPNTAPSTAAALLIDLSKSQNQEHTSTENTTVSFTGAKTGMSGFLMFLQGATGRTFTFPADGSGIEYDDTLKAMVIANTLIDTTAGRRTVLTYTVLADVADRIYITGRSISLKP